MVLGVEQLAVQGWHVLPAGVVEGSGVVQLVVSGTGVDDVAHNAVVSIAVVPLLVVVPENVLVSAVVVRL